MIEIKVEIRKALVKYLDHMIQIWIFRGYQVRAANDSKDGTSKNSLYMKQGI